MKQENTPSLLNTYGHYAFSMEYQQIIFWDFLKDYRGPDNYIGTLYLDIEQIYR